MFSPSEFPACRSAIRLPTSISHAFVLVLPSRTLQMRSSGSAWDGIGVWSQASTTVSAFTKRTVARFDSQMSRKFRTLSPNSHGWRRRCFEDCVAVGHPLDLLQPGAGCYIVVMQHRYTECPPNQFSGAIAVHAFCPHSRLTLRLRRGSLWR